MTFNWPKLLFSWEFVSGYDRGDTRWYDTLQHDMILCNAEYLEMGVQAIKEKAEEGNWKITSSTGKRQLNQTGHEDLETGRQDSVNRRTCRPSPGMLFSGILTDSRVLCELKEQAARHVTVTSHDSSYSLIRWDILYICCIINTLNPIQ